MGKYWWAQHLNCSPRGAHSVKPTYCWQGVHTTGLHLLTLEQMSTWSTMDWHDIHLLHNWGGPCPPCPGGPPLPSEENPLWLVKGAYRSTQPRSLPSPTGPSLSPRSSYKYSLALLISNGTAWKQPLSPLLPPPMLLGKGSAKGSDPSFSQLGE